MRRDVLVAVAAGVLGALLLVAAWRGSLVGVFAGLLLSPLPLAMTALGLGLTYLPLAIVSGAVTVAVMTGSFGLAAVYLVVDAAPVAILTRIGLAAQATRPLEGRVIGLTLIALTFAAVTLMVTGLAAFPAGPDGIEASLREQLVKLLAEVQAAGGPGRPQVPEAIVTAMARLFPGAAGWNWCFRALLCAGLGQSLLARDGFARWPTPAYRTLAVPGWYIGAFWAAAFAGWLTPGDVGFVAANTAAVLSLPLVLQGLAVVHCAAARAGFGRGVLFAFYTVALVAAGAALALIVILGVMDHFLQLRARLLATRTGGQ